MAMIAALKGYRLRLIMPGQHESRAAGLYAGLWR
ncbi:hypothetical protein [Leminorella grimontii]